MKRFIKHRHLFTHLLQIFLLLAFIAAPLSAQDEEEFSQEEFSQNESTENDPVKLFNKGQEAHEKGELETAVKFYKEAIKISTEFPEAEFQLANAFESLGKVEEAEKAFRRALQTRPDWTLAMSGLGSLLIKKGDFSEAESLLYKAIKLNELNFPAYAALTELKLLQKSSDAELKGLLAKIQYLTTKAKTPASVWAARGALERKLDQKESAKTSIEKALSIDSKNVVAMSEKIEVSLSEGDYKSAIADAGNLIQIAPNLEAGKILLAKAYALSGDSVGALDILNKIENPSSNANALKASIELNKNESVEGLEKVLAENEKNVSVLARLCILSRTDNPQKALEYCKQASSLEPNNINHAIGFGAALVQLERYADAVGLFRNLLKASPDNYTIHANLATALFQMQDFENAKIEYKWITQNQPKLAIAYYFLAISHDKLEEYIDALANYQQFLRLADKEQQKLEIEKVDLRLPILQRQIKSGKGKKPKGR